MGRTNWYGKGKEHPVACTCVACEKARRSGEKYWLPDGPINLRWYKDRGMAGGWRTEAPSPGSGSPDAGSQEVKRPAVVPWAIGACSLLLLGALLVILRMIG